MPDTTSTWLKY